MELSMYSSRNYTEEKESGWLQKTQQKHPERLFVCSAPKVEEFWLVKFKVIFWLDIYV